MTASPPFDDAPIPKRPPGRKPRDPNGDQLTLEQGAKLLGWNAASFAARIHAGTAPGRVQGDRYDVRRGWICDYLAGAPGFWDRSYLDAIAAIVAERILAIPLEMTEALLRAVTGAPATSRTPVALDLIRRAGD